MRLAWLALFLPLMACGAEGADTNIANDFGSAADGSGTASDMGVSCASVTISATSPFTGATLTAIAHAKSTGIPTWTVSNPDGNPTQLDGSGLVVSYVASTPGTYTFYVTFAGNLSCNAYASFTVKDPAGRSEGYVLRVTPPQSFALPQHDFEVQLFGDAPQLANDLYFPSPATLTGKLQGPSGAIAGEVALFPATGPEARVSVDATGLFSMPISLTEMYRVVLIPASPVLAPKRIGPLAGAALLSTDFSVDGGATVSGSVTDESAQAIAGASIALRQGVLPSGLGTSSATGAFSLRAQVGASTLAVSATARPDLALPNVAVSAGMTIAVQHTLPRVAVTTKIVGVDGVTPVANASVALGSALIPAAGIVTIGSVTTPVGGIAHAQCITAADGTCAAASLPAGDYDVLVEPPASWPSTAGGRTALHVTVASAGTMTLQLAMAKSISGQVLRGGGDGVPGVRVRARSRGNSTVTDTLSAADGSFTIAADAGLPVEIWLDPPIGAQLASAHRQLGDGASTYVASLPALGAITLGAGQTLAGVLRAPSNSPVANAAIDVLCVSCGSAVPVAHTEASASGEYTLELPDPGLLAIDAGTD